jgi:hypothetical protein
MNTMLLILLMVTFLSGIYYCVKVSSFKLSLTEGLTNMANPRCPDILVQKDKKYFLYNSKVAKVPGVNPVEFDNLEDYVEFMDWQRSQGIRCPVLYLQTTYDAQGNSVYKVRPSPTDLHGGLPPALANKPTAPSKSAATKDPSSISTPIPTNLDSKVIIKKMTGPNPTMLIDATRNDQPYNLNSVPGFDQTDFYQGTTTPLDQMNQEQENMLYSPDPMDPTGGGQAYTQKLVDSGYYADNEVSIRI